MRMFREVFILSVFVSVGICAVANIKSCYEESTPCNVTEVRIDPCKKASACELKRGKSASISFDYTPEFSATSLQTNVKYGLVAFSGLDPNACPSTTCPVEAGQSYTYNYNLEVSKKFPQGTFPVKWKIWDESNEKNYCCFATKFKLV